MLVKKKGQSTLEYVLVLSAIIAAIIFAAFQFVKPRLQDSMNKVSNEMSKAINKINMTR
jgi:uncharacterized protein (UPF0333 family)